MRPLLELSALGKVFPTDDGGFEALRNVNLKIREGEFISLIGHSGCGCLLYTSPSPRDRQKSRMPSSA